MKRSLLLAGLLLGWAQSAQAEFAVCNQTLDVMNVSVGFYDVTNFVTEGWWTIGPNQCANVIPDRLDARYIYVFAQDAFGKTIIAGDKTMCVGQGRFRLTGIENCLIEGNLTASFHEVDTQRSERWTLFITPPDGSN